MNAMSKRDFMNRENVEKMAVERRLAVETLDDGDGRCTISARVNVKVRETTSVAYK